MDLDFKKELESQVAMLRVIERLQVNPDYIKLMARINGKVVADKVKSIATLVKHEESTNIAYEELKAISFYGSIIEALITEGNVASDQLNQED